MLLILLFSCRPGDVAEAIVSDVVPTVVRLNWDSRREGRSFVRYGETSVQLSTPLTASPGTSHSVTVYGLKAGQDVVLQGVVQDQDGNEELTETVELSLEAPPADLPRFELSADSEGLLPGYVLLSLIEPEQGWVLILDQDADPVWFTKVEGGLAAMSPSPSSDGESLLFDAYDIEDRTVLSLMTRMKLDGSERVDTRLPLGHHAFAELPAGDIAWIATDIREAQVNGDTIEVAGDSVRIREEGTVEEQGREVFSFWDLTDPYVSCDHFYLDANLTGARDWTHANSLMYLPEDESMVVLSKHLDALVKFDAGTGERLWQIGGRNETLVSADDSTGWSHGHLSQIWDDGFVIFDNSYHDGTVSRASEYRFDLSTGMYKRVWDYQHPQGAFVQLLGDVRKLPDASYLVSWTSLGTLSRIDGEGTVLWQAESDLGAATGRVRFIEDLYTLDQPSR